MRKALRLHVITPTAPLLKVASARWARIQLADGAIGILPGHAPLIAETVAAPLRYADSRGEHTIELEAGLLWVDGAGITLLTLGVARPPEAQAAEAAGARFGRLARALGAGLNASPEQEPDDAQA